MVAKTFDNKFNFTKQSIEKIELPEKQKDGKIKNLVFHDTKQSGLCLIVSYGGSKTFYLLVKIHGIPHRIKLGKFPETTVEQARKFTIEKKSLINQGINPNDEKRKLTKEMTFKDLFEKFKTDYILKKSKPSTVKHYTRSFEKNLVKFHSKKPSLITRDDIEKLHQKIGEENGKYLANRVLSLLSVMFNYAILKEICEKNPCIGVEKFEEKKRDRFIRPNEMMEFLKALIAEENVVIRSYIYISLLTGVRKSNVLSMKWEDVDYTLKHWRIPETKNGETLVLPIMSAVIEEMNFLKEYYKEKRIVSEYVFYSKTSKSGHIEEPKKAWKRILTRANITNLRIHDMRRTFGSYQAINGQSLHIIGKTLGHKTTAATEIYSRLTLDPLRESIEGAMSSIVTMKNSLHNKVG